jgi:hypothetical protein
MSMGMDDGEVRYLGSSTTKYMDFGASGSNTKFHGKVGIGITPSAQELEIWKSSGDVAAKISVGANSADAVLRLQGGNATGESSIFFGDEDDVDIGKISYLNNGNHMTFTTNTAERLRIKSDGNIITSTGSPLSYEIGSDYKVHNDPDEVVTEDDNTNSDYHIMKTFVAVKSGKLRFRWEGYIQSGAYYWAGSFYKNGSLMKKSNGSTDAHHTYSQSLASGFSDSVHNYRTFEMDLDDVAPGDIITYRMVSSTSGGTPQVGSGQNLYCKNFAAYSTTPTVETHFPHTLAPTPMAATGGTITTVGGYKIHKFTSSGTFTVTTVGHGKVDFIVVAGGGAGGGSQGYGWPGGGGGAGGMRTGSDYTVSATSYSITVGGGGSVNNGGQGGNGGSSSGFGTSCTGGGGGGYGNWTGVGSAGSSGGSGGGGGQSSAIRGGGSGTSGEGNSGGTSRIASNGGYAPGGGGGKGGAGATAGVAGAGEASSITGSSVTYATGGGGGNSGNQTGGANTGNGGEGYIGGNSTAYAGGSGVVIVRYAI